MIRNAFMGVLGLIAVLSGALTVAPYNASEAAPICFTLAVGFLSLLMASGPPASAAER